ncbi:MAG: AbrB/MazE/SpoVT family DNA-binding domain-containing protein [Candidatus Sumerlaeia bacterium]
MGNAFRATVRVTHGGRIVIPAEVRESLQMGIGEELVLTVEADHATLTNAKVARRKAREKVRKYVPPGTSLSRELMAERKAEAKHE